MVKEGDTEMPHIKDGKIRLKENGVWEIRYRRNGYNKSFSSKNLETAKKAFKTFLTEIKGKIKPNEIKTDYTVNNAFEQWFNEMHTVNVKEITSKTTLRIWNKHFHEKGNIKLKQPSNTYQSILTELVKEGKTKTATELRNILNQIYRYAIANGKIKDNPIEPTKIPKHQRENGKALTYEEENILLKAIESHKYKIAYILMLYTGARRSELKTIEINEERQSITLNSSKIKTGQREQEREIPINPKIQNYINEIKKTDLSSINLDKMSVEFKKILPNHHTHELRHTFISRSAEKTIPIELISKWVGHSGKTMTDKVYLHFSWEYEVEQAKKLDY